MIRIALALLLVACGRVPTAPVKAVPRVAPADTCEPMPYCINPTPPAPWDIR
jgi:hypothetical protein